MASTHPGVLSSPFVISVVVPSTLLICSVALFKAQWTPVAVAAAACLAAVQVFVNRTRAILDPIRFQSFPLIQKTVLSHNTAVYRFGLPSSKSILGLPIGQHISVAAELDVTDAKTSTVTRREVVRSYTPISSDNDLGYFDLLIKAYPTGNISRHMSTLNIGDTLKVKGPKGAMVYTPNMVERFGMIAGGTGITPMLQIIKAIHRGRNMGDRTEVNLIFANVNEEDILLRKELNDMVAADKKIHVHYMLNNPPEKWLGGVGFVTSDVIKEMLPPPGPNMKILICGPPPMVSAMKKATESLGYNKARVVSKLEDQVFCF